MDIRERLLELEDEPYKKFSAKLTKTKYPLIGIRIPLLKKIAKELKDENLCFDKAIYFEEVMLEGLLIGHYNNINIVIEKLKVFINKIDDWSVCDSCCANLKITKKHKEKMWKFITSFKDSNREFEVRFMIVMMMGYYLEEEYISDIFKIIDNIKCDLYYANMAISWLLATSLVKLEMKTLEYLYNCNLSNFIFNKTISKACESYRVKDELKKKLKKMKK